MRHKNGLKTSLTFFFLENAQNLGRSDDAKRRKKWGWPNHLKNLGHLAEMSVLNLRLVTFESKVLLIKNRRDIPYYYID